MRIDAAGWPFVLGALAIGIAAALLLPWLLVPFLVLAAFFLFFFRDPDRRIAQGDDLVLSPADGRVMVAGDPAGQGAPPGQWKQISIFLSPMNVHINRVPVGGRITKVSYTPGKFLPAYRADAGALNERSEIWIDHDGQTVVARQIVGILARRVVCRAEADTVVKAGDRYGVMKFGSRMDIFVPVDADIRVRAGEDVRAGETVIAVLHSKP